MAKVEDVADIIVAWYNNQSEPCITNLMLNKLLYFAQGHYLSELNKTLFEDDFELINQTPVIPNIYEEYKRYGNNNIYSINTLSECYEKLDKQELNFLLSIIKKYSNYSATKLFYIVQEINTTLVSSNDIISKQEIKTLFENIEID